MPHTDYSGPLRAELRTLRLTEPFRIAHGTSAERTVLRLHQGDAVGEAPFVPYYKEDTSDTLRWLQNLAWSGGPAPAQGPHSAMSVYLEPSLIYGTNTAHWPRSKQLVPPAMFVRFSTSRTL